MSQLDKHEKEIGGTVYLMRMLPPKKARALLLKMTKVVAPSLDGLSMEADVLSALGGVSERLSEEDLDYAMDLLSTVTDFRLPNGNEPNLKDKFDLHFTGKLGDMFRWFAWGLSVQYADFFGESGIISQLDRKEKA